jgi:hypothetical protein
MCASRSVLFRPERRNESEFFIRYDPYAVTPQWVTVGRSNSPPIPLIDGLAEL